MNKMNKMPEVVYDVMTGAIYEIDRFGNNKFIGWSC